MKGKNFYQILGLTLEATQKEIKHAYRLLARKYHPDVSNVRNAEEKFKTMGEAYEVLKNPKKRREYDRQNSHRPQNKKRSKSSPKRKRYYDRFNEKDAADLNSFYEDQFGVNKNNSDENSFNIDGKDIHARMMIDLEHSLNGASQQFTVEIPVYTPQGELITKNKTLNVQIPRGIREGDIIRLAKQGSPGMGAAAGDFLIEVAFNQHEIYTVDGSNIYMNLHVSPQQLKQGAKIKVSSPNQSMGKIILTIPKNTQQGVKQRFEGHGIPSQIFGDFYVVLQETNHSKADGSSKAEYEQAYSNYSR